MNEPPLSPELLRLAYAQGYFPMPDPKTGRTLWFNPDPRAVIPLDGFHVSRSLARTLKRAELQVTVNQAFDEVMAACADREETWITDEFKRVYLDLHREGGAHSLEIWQGKDLVGGVYGVSLAGAFFAESMFHRVRDASKVALYHLVQRMRERGMVLLEVQFMTDHLASLGAVEIPRDAYLKALARALESEAKFA